MELSIHQIADLTAAAASRLGHDAAASAAIGAEILRVLVKREMMLDDWRHESMQREVK